MPAFSSVAFERLGDRLAEVRVVGDQRHALEVLGLGMREQRGDLHRAERAGLPEVRVVELRRQVVGRVHRRHLRRLRFHGHGLLLLRGRAERDAEDEDRALLDQLARERRRNVGPRLVVLDQQLDLAAEQAAAPVDFVGAENHAFGRGLGVRLGYADAIGDHADLYCLRTRGSDAQRECQQPPDPHHVSSSIEQSLFIHPSYTKIHRLLQQLRLALVVVGRALDDVECLVRARRRVMDDARMRLRHRVIGRVLDREQAAR